MTLSRAVLVSSLVFLGAVVTQADSISPGDPKIIVGRGVDSISITTLQFSVPVDTSGGGIFDFDNGTAFDWSGLKLTITFPNAVDAKAAGVSCSNGDISSDIFSDCTSERQGRTLTIFLTGGEIAPCVGSSCPIDSEFFVDLNTGGHNPHGQGGWKTDTIEVQALTTPEPGTLVLLVAGLGAFWVPWKRGQ